MLNKLPINNYHQTICLIHKSNQLHVEIGIIWSRDKPGRRQVLQSDGQPFWVVSIIMVVTVILSVLMATLSHWDG